MVGLRVHNSQPIVSGLCSADECVSTAQRLCTVMPKLRDAAGLVTIQQPYSQLPVSKA